jgi:hypothetical protein
LSKERAISCKYEFTGILCSFKDKDSGLQIPCIKRFDVKEGHKDEFLPLRTGDRLIVPDLSIDELLVRSSRPPLDLKFVYGFVPYMEGDSLGQFIKAVHEERPCKIVRFVSL